MAINIEVKVRVSDLAKVRRRVQQTRARGPWFLDQVDTFFPVPHGRLKLRVESSDLPDSQERRDLIAYSRTDKAEGRASHYEIYQVGDWQSLQTCLTNSLGQGPVVRKRRELYLIGRTRIHLDSVTGLGEFVEIEVVMEANEPDSAGHGELQKLMEILGLNDEQVMDVAYADLLQSEDQ